MRTINPAAITQQEKNFSRWQEGARKDIERAFGVLQCKFKAMCTPILSLHMGGATNLTACCIILHNMGVSDRIMGDVYARYDPSKVVDNSGVSHMQVDAGVDNNITHRVTAPSFSTETNDHREQLLQNFGRGDYAAMGVLRLLEEKELVDEVEWRRLQMALLNEKGRDHRAPP